MGQPLARRSEWSAKHSVFWMLRLRTLVRRLGGNVARARVDDRVIDHAKSRETEERRRRWQQARCEGGPRLAGA